MKTKTTTKTLQILFLSVICFLLGHSINAQVNLKHLGRYATGNFYNVAGAEIVAYDGISRRMFVINGPDTSLRFVNLSNPANPVEVANISIKPFGIDLTSVAFKNGIVAVTVIDSLGKTANGKVVFFNTNGSYLNQVKVGPNPDMLCFTPDGRRVLVANEGEPNVGYTIDPEGSVSIINISGGVQNLNQSHVTTAGFTQFNGTQIDWRIKITGRILNSQGQFIRNSTIAEDLEPEYIGVSDDSKTAWITCQENNCMAELNIETATITRLIPLGFKNHNLPGNGLDASDNGTTINIANWPVFGMYQPDVVTTYKVGNTTYLVTANEGDARADWGAENNEEIRFGSSSYVLDTVKFGGATNVAALKANTALGRLNVTNRFGDFNNDGKFDSVFCFGARSFTIWNATTGALVWDSKDEFEQRLATIYPSNFNASNSNNTLKNRSDDKGPEPEAVAIGKILDSTYAFVGLERIGGIMVYNITNPNNPYFVQYINMRNFSVTPGAGTLSTVGDLGPEGVVFVPASESHTGKPLLLVSNEISSTVSIFEINSRSSFQLQILHSGDMESSVDAVIDAPNFAAVVDKLEDEHINNINISSGDNILPGPFMASGEDPSLQTPLRNTASAYWAGNPGQIRAAIGRPDIAIMNVIGYHVSALGNHEFDLGTTELNSQIGVDIRSNGADRRWIGAQFPFVSCNLDFSQDVNLNYLYTNQILRDTAFRTPVGITNNNQKRGIAPSVIIERSGHKIGVVGATTQVLERISSPGATRVIGPKVDDMPALAAIIQPFVDSLIIKEGVNKVILVSHLQQIANEKALAPLLKGVDIIVAGGNHAISADGNDRLRPGNIATERYPILTQNKDGEPLAILNMASEWKYVGRFVCDFDSLGRLIPNVLDSSINGAYITDSAMVTQLYGTYAAGFTAGSKGANVRTLAQAVGNVITAKDGNIVGKTNVFLEGRRNFVRTEETNLGNLSSDANLWYARLYDPTVKVSIKNGGGIRSAIGFVNAVGGNAVLERTQANPSANKQAGDVSQLDIENSLRFNNGLVIVTANAAGLRRLIEHGISATIPNATPGQFPQVGGVAFSYDTTRPAGSKLWSLVTIDSVGNRVDTILRNGQYVGDTSRLFKIVTLNFLVTGGDNYPFPANSTNRINLDTAIKTAGASTFAAIGSEQDAFAEYMLARHNTTNTAYSVRDTNLYGDRRIQLLNTRPDGIFPETTPVMSIGAARLVGQPATVRVRGVVTRAWGRFIYIQDATGGIGVRQASGAMVDAITAGNLKEGDSVEVIGPRNEFNNYAQIQLASGTYNSLNSVTVLASNRTVQPVTVTLKQLNQNGEAFESRLIRVVGLRTAATGNFTASTNYTIWDGTTAGDTMIMRVIAAQDSEMDDAPLTEIPNSVFTFEGVLIQFCSSPTIGCTSGYQLQLVRKKEIIALPQPFVLNAPANNARVITKSNDNTPVIINWRQSGNATRYRWVLDIPQGNFMMPLFSLTPTNNGRDTFVTLTISAIDGLLASNNLKIGDSIDLKWTVFAYRNNDSLAAINSFNIRFVRGSTINAFSLVAPANNATVDIVEGSSTPVNIIWRSAGVNSYKWMLKTPTGTFTAPLAVLRSNNNGADTILTLTVGAIDNLLAALGVAKGTNTSTQWTVYAYAGNDSLKATETFNITFNRLKTLRAFNLVSPADNANVIVQQGSNTPVNITWRSADAATYKWMLKTPSGVFTAPLLSLPSNNAGTDTVLTLTSGTIDNVLASLGVAKGASINAQWTVYGYLRGDSLKAVETFNITLTRQRTLQPFDLISPANNTRLVVEEGNNTPVNITWGSSASNATYKWLVALLGGDINSPFVTLPSNNNGTATTLTITSGGIDALLSANGVPKGDSINLIWSVRALEGNIDSLKATSTFNIKIVRAASVGINNVTFDNSVNVYPNPADNILIVTSDKNISITLMTAEGKIISVEPKSVSHKLQLENLKQGVYLLMICDDNNNTTIKRFIKK
ncbi:MAG: choice-of-anchor I family protein [Bacteroidia bacterium]